MSRFSYAMYRRFFLLENAYNNNEYFAPYSVPMVRLSSFINDSSPLHYYLIQALSLPAVLTFPFVLHGSHGFPARHATTSFYHFNTATWSLCSKHKERYSFLPSCRTTVCLRNALAFFPGDRGIFSLRSPSLPDRILRSIVFLFHFTQFSTVSPA
jgi:hypothetical protein